VNAFWIAAFCALSGVVLVVALVVLGVLHRVLPVIERADRVIAAAVERMRVSGLPAGAVVPDFQAATWNGRPFSAVDLEGERTVVLFIESGCTSCDTFKGDLEAGTLPSLDFRLVVVASNEADAASFAAAERDGVVVLLQRARAVSRVFESDRTPHAFMLDAHRVVSGSGWPNTWEALDDQVRRLEGDQQEGANFALAAGH
jgi:hypothetical protein